jgi:hypothetical protein
MKLPGRVGEEGEFVTERRIESPDFKIPEEGQGCEGKQETDAAHHEWRMLLISDPPGTLSVHSTIYNPRFAVGLKVRAAPTTQLLAARIRESLAKLA